LEYDKTLVRSAEYGPSSGRTSRLHGVVFETPDGKSDYSEKILQKLRGIGRYAMNIVFFSLSFILFSSVVVVQIKITRSFNLRYRTFHKVPAVILSKRSSGLGNGQTYDNLEYTTSEGEVRILKSMTRVGNMDKSNPTFVYYNPNNPEEAFQDIKAAQFLPLLVGLPFALASFIVGIVLSM